MISCHLRDIGGYRSTVAYICYHGKEPWDTSKYRPDGVYGGLAHVIPSVPIKDRTVVGRFDKIECMPIT